jgi:hypothetical protein
MFMKFKTFHQDAANEIVEGAKDVEIERSDRTEGAESQ